MNFINRQEKHPTPNIHHPMNLSRGRNACRTLPDLYQQVAGDFCKCLMQHPTFIVSLPVFGFKSPRRQERPAKRAAQSLQPQD